MCIAILIREYEVSIAVELQEEAWFVKSMSHRNKILKNFKPTAL